jgi:hypothetical protein
MIYKSVANFMQMNQCLTRRKLKKGIFWLKKYLDKTGVCLEASLKKVTALIGSSIRGVQIGYTHSNKTA